MEQEQVEAITAQFTAGPLQSESYADFARLERGEKKYQPAPCDLVEVAAVKGAHAGIEWLAPEPIDVLDRS